MIKAAAGALIGLASMVILFLADPAWDCNLEVEAPRIIEQTPRSFKSEGGAILTTGSLFTNSRMSTGGDVPGPLRTYTDIGGGGQYLASYQGDIVEVAVFQQGREVYRGPPKSEFQMGPGGVAIELRGGGTLRARFSDRCSLRTTLAAITRE